MTDLACKDGTIQDEVGSSNLPLTQHDNIWKINLTNELWCKYAPLEMQIHVDWCQLGHTELPFVAFSPTSNPSNLFFFFF